MVPVTYAGDLAGAARDLARTEAPPGPLAQALCTAVYYGLVRIVVWRVLVCVAFDLG